MLDEDASGVRGGENEALTPPALAGSGHFSRQGSSEMVGSPQVRRVETKQEASCRKPAPLSRNRSSITSGGPPITLRQSLGRIWPLLGPVCLELFVRMARSVIFFAFLRTTVDCGRATPDDFDRSSSDWSGSRHCNDRCLVAREAQFLKGIADGVEQAIQFWSTPILGVLSDSVIGRRPIGISSVTGLMLSVLALGCAALARRGDGVLALVVIGSAVKGTTECFYLIVDSSVSDVFGSTRSRGYTYGVLQVYRLFCTGLAIIVATGAVISRNLYDYSWVFWSLSALCFVNAVIVIPFVVPETNTSATEAFDCANASPLRTFRVLWRLPYIGMIGAAVFFILFAVTVLSIAQAFVIAAYGWTQTVSVIVLICVGAFGFAAAALSPKLITRYGARRVFRVAIASANLGLAIMTFSPLSPVFFLSGALFVAVALVGTPAYLALVTRQVRPVDLGVTLGAISSLAIAAIAIGAPVYAAIFRSVGSGGQCGGDTKNEISWIPWGLATISMSIGHAIVHVWDQKFPVSRDERRKPLSGSASVAFDAKTTHQSNAPTPEAPTTVVQLEDRDKMDAINVIRQV